MKKSYILLLFTLIISCRAERYITYGLNGGRFGDNVFNYFKARWLAHKYDLVFLYKPFGHSHLLGMHQFEKRYNISYAKSRKVIDVKFEKIIANNTDEDILFVSNFYINLGDYFKYPIQDPEFRRLLHKMLEPTVPIEKLPLPDDMLTIAVHVRKGSGRDGRLFSNQIYRSRRAKQDFVDKKVPNKFPPEQYYINQINDLSAILDNPPMYIYLFTDADKPKSLVNRFKKYVKNKNIVIESRSQNQWSRTTLEDYYRMVHFDILIRSDSYFSLASLLLGNHAISIRPIKFRWSGNNLLIDKLSLHLIDLEQNKEQHVLLEKLDDSVKDLILAHLPQKG